jgi:hypothetical protein
MLLSPENAVVQILATNPAVALRVGLQIFPLAVPKGATFPFVTYRRLNIAREPHLAGPSYAPLVSLQVSSWAVNHDQARRLADEVRLALDGRVGVAAGVEIEDMRLVSEADDYIDPTEVGAQLPPAYEVRQLYQIRWQEYQPPPPDPVLPVTFYFNAADDLNWTTVSNWWLDAGHSQAAGSLPTADDNVISTADIIASGQTVANFTLLSPGSDFIFLEGTLAVTGTATFSGPAFNDGTLVGNAVFDGTSANLGTVAGNAVFNDTSLNNLFAVVTGTATFNDAAINLGE